MNAIVTIKIGERAEKIAALTGKAMRAYARKICADLVEITNPVCGSAHWAKVEIFDLFEIYDRVLYLDNDILITPKAPNIFDHVPDTHIGALLESQFTDREAVMNEYLSGMHYSWNPIPFKYLNTGVLVIPDRWRRVFESPGEEEIKRNIQFKKDHWDSQFHDQSFFNWRTNVCRADIFDIGPKFNWMDVMDDISSESRYDAHFIHYAGLGKCMKDELLDQIVKDIGKLGDGADAKEEVEGSDKL